MREFGRLLLFMLGFVVSGAIVFLWGMQPAHAVAGPTKYAWCVGSTGSTPTGTWPYSVSKCGADPTEVGQAVCDSFVAEYQGPYPLYEVNAKTQFEWSFKCYKIGRTKCYLNKDPVYEGCSTVGGLRYRKCDYGSAALTSWHQFGASSTVCPTDPEEPPPDPCKDKAGKKASSGYYLLGTDPSSGSFPNVACSGSCEVIFSGACPEAVRLVAGVSTYYCKGSFEYSGASCSSGTGPPSTTTPPNDSCPPGQEVKSDPSTGSKSCAGPTDPDPPKPPPCTAANTPPGCTGTPPPGPPGGGGGGDDPEEPPPPEPPDEGDGPGKTFCEENPTAPGCNKGEFGGVCAQGQANFSCSGDAVACATAKAAAQLECKFENSATFDQLRASIGPAYAPDNYMEKMTRTYDIGGLIDMSDQDGGSCPSVPPIEFYGQTVEWPMEKICELGPMVRYIMIFAAAMVALRILFTG